MNGPLVSILTPSLNQVAFVGECLQSIDRQDYADIEHVVVDGGSSDGTLDLVAAHGGPRRRVLVVPGCSQAEALNVALQHSKGEIVGWLNTDDAFFGEDAVSTVARRFGDPGCAVVYGNGAIADERGRVLRCQFASDAVLAELPLASPIAQPAAFIRRAVLGEALVREDLELALDYELWLRLSRRHRFCKVERILAIDRDHGSRKLRRGGHAALREELRRVSSEYGIAHRRRRSAGQLARAWRRRSACVVEFMRLEQRYRFAFSYRPDPRWRRAVRQLAVPQRFLRGI
jgi:glycosyltransferase involved in cell wall biosynthesis